VCYLKQLSSFNKRREEEVKVFEKPSKEDGLKLSKKFYL